VWLMLACKQQPCWAPEQNHPPTLCFPDMNRMRHHSELCCCSKRTDAFTPHDAYDRPDQSLHVLVRVCPQV
jgi:hypothetical protein